MTGKSRIIGERSGSVHGPLLVVLTQIHGNEPAGFYAVQDVFNKIDEEYLKKPHFDFRGKLLGLVGNLAAAKKSVRYIDTDLNRLWTQDNVKRITSTPKEDLTVVEEIQLKEILEIIHEQIETYKPERVVVLDLHTTTAFGGIFVIPTKETKSREIGLAIQAPVLHGFLDDLKGTVLHHFTQENYKDIDLTSICFESGQHNSSDSIGHAVSAIIQCFMSIGGFYPDDVETKHEQLLTQDADKLPKEALLIYSHKIMEGDNFSMRRNKIYGNFDKVSEGELLATDRHGEIRAKCDGLILMPLYQKQGNDGFFIIKDVSDSASRLNRKIPITTLNA
jgi:succinylglutamate desuccinylase